MLPFLNVHAVEYFVSTTGSDASDGLTQSTAFASIQKGVDALASGDILTIFPGEYFGSALRKDLGSLEKETLIRALIPGTAVIRGDVMAPSFTPQAGYLHVVAADFSGEVQGVSEADALRQLKQAPTLNDIEFMPGSFFYDQTARKLYLSTTDLRPASSHAYTISVSGQHGLALQGAKKVTVDGLVFRGFVSLVPLRDSDPQFVTWGLFMNKAVNCVIRNCTALLNGGGLLLGSEIPGGNLIENCTGYGNGSPHNSEGGNISIFHPNNDVIRNCVGYRSLGTGVRMYGTATGTNVIESSIGWDNEGPALGLKGLGTEASWNRNSIGLGTLPGMNLDHCIVGTKTVYLAEDQAPKDTVLLQKENIVSNREFVDPVNFDFRLQSTSKLRGAAPGGGDRGPFSYKPNVFFVRPEGDDAADGLSIKTAWKTASRAIRNLKSGDTVYFEEGTYDGPINIRAGTAGGAPISLRGRGTSRVLFPGPVQVDGSHGVEFRRIAFSETVVASDCTDMNFDNCVFQGVDFGVKAVSLHGLAIRHSEFLRVGTAGISLQESERVTLESNLFENNRGVAVKMGRQAQSGVLDWVRSLWASKPDRPEADSGVAYSDYNAFADEKNAWSVDGRALSLDAIRPLHENYSFGQKPDYQGLNGAWILRNQVLFAGRGARGQSVGRHQDIAGRALFMSKPVVHSVSATTANFEWLVSQGADCEVAWGETPECENARNFTISTPVELHRTFSLTGLKPATKYYFRVKSIRLLPFIDFGKADVVDPHYDTLSFTTLAEDPAPRNWYVAPDGNDNNSGLRRDQPCRTVGFAASKAGPGDTVLIAGGSYPECVRVRNTGDKGKPIKFRSMPGERVIFDGNQNRLDTAWVINGKEHVEIDGFYFLHHRGECGGNLSTRLINIVQSRDITVRRCLMDGRGSGGYPASFMTAYSTENLTLSNIVSIMAPDGIELTDCPGFRLENSVFLLTMIANVKLGMPATLASNIFCDSGPFKALQKVALQVYSNVQGMAEKNNCYYFRLPDEERLAFWIGGLPSEGAPQTKAVYSGSLLLSTPGLAHIGLSEFQRRMPGVDSFIANPEFSVMKRLTGKTIPPFPIDVLYDVGIQLDFPDFFTTNPELEKRGIGLQPAAFEDFHFNKPPASLP
ncbi:MAG: right-handed parallel beta-helix repeat-containing protein [Verrucomicrobiota bacterium]